MREQEDMDAALRELLLLYDAIYLLEPKRDRIRSLLSGVTLAGTSEREASRVEPMRQRYASEKVFPDDQRRYLEFSDLRGLERNVRGVEGGKHMGYFRIRGRHGRYVWKLFTFMALPNEDDKYLLCIEDAAVNDMDTLALFINSLGLGGSSGGSQSEEEVLWHNLMLNTRVNYFWKDRDRRFKGASRSFLDYYGFTSVDEILGKTDEDMGWHVEEGPYRNDELAVIEEGKSFFDVPGKCIIKGVVHNIRANKVPLYRDGQIVGLLGYFVDAERSFGEDRGEQNGAITDRATGVMNSRGLWESILGYTEDYYANGSRFAIMVIGIPEYPRIRDAYGEEVGEHLLGKIARRIVGQVGVDAAVARLAGAGFAVVMKYDAKEQVINASKEVCALVSAIHEVDGHDCTVRAFAGIAYEDDVSTVDGIINMAIRRAQGLAREHSGQGDKI
jgi:diguanylate cyclase (GGDEF)-like protein